MHNATKVGGALDAHKKSGLWTEAQDKNVELAVTTDDFVVRLKGHL